MRVPVLAAIALACVACNSVSAGTAPPRSHTLAINGDWTSFAPATPDARTGHEIAYDVLRGRLILVGGKVPGVGDVNDTWALSLTTPSAWTRLGTTGTPPSPRDTHSAVYDPLNDRVLVFGGTPYDGAPGTVYALSLSTNTWSTVISGTGPVARQGHSAIFDPIDNTMVVFGGLDANGAYLNDVWALSLSGSATWTQLTPTGTPPNGRRLHGAVFDPSRNRMIVYGGESNGSESNAVWQLSFGTMSWLQRTTPDSPGKRYGHGAALDASRDRLVIFGGTDVVSHGDLNDVWVLPLNDSTTWTQVSPPGVQPPAASSAIMRYDPPRDRFLLVGGSANYAQGGGAITSWSIPANLSSAWTQLLPAPRIGRALVGAGGAWDSRRARTILVHGCGPLGEFSSEVWSLSMATGSPVWTAIAVSGGTPTPRAYHTAVYDSLHDQVVMFGGTSSLPIATPLNDTWTLSFTNDSTATWTQLTPVGTPPSARAGHGAVVDAVNGRMLVTCGGADPLGTNGTSDVWSLTLAAPQTWTQLAPGGTAPSARVGAAVTINTVRRQLLVTCGVTGPGSYASDAYAMSLDGTPAWSSLSAVGTAPTGRRYATASYDALRDRVLVIGGEDVTGAAQTGAFELLTGLTPAWSALAPGGTTPAARKAHVAVYDRVNDRAIVYGGSQNVSGYGELRLRDVVTLAFGNVVAVADPAPRPGTFAIHAIAPLPARRGSSIRVELAVPATSHAEARVQILDVRGRVVAQRALDADELSSGVARVNVSAALAPGTYLVRVTHAGQSAARAIAVID